MRSWFLASNEMLGLCIYRSDSCRVLCFLFLFKHNFIFIKKKNYHKKYFLLIMASLLGTLGSIGTSLLGDLFTRGAKTIGDVAT